MKVTYEKRRELESEMWIHKAKQMAAIDVFQYGRITQKTIEFLWCLPKEIRDKLYKLALDKESHEKLITDFFDFEEIYVVPFEDMQIPKIEIQQIEKLLE